MHSPTPALSSNSDNMFCACVQIVRACTTAAERQAQISGAGHPSPGPPSRLTSPGFASPRPGSPRLTACPAEAHLRRARILLGIAVVHVQCGHAIQLGQHERTLVNVASRVGGQKPWAARACAFALSWGTSHELLPTALRTHPSDPEVVLLLVRELEVGVEFIETLHHLEWARGCIGAVPAAGQGQGRWASASRSLGICIEK